MWRAFECSTWFRWPARCTHYLSFTMFADNQHELLTRQVLRTGAENNSSIPELCMHVPSFPTLLAFPFCSSLSLTHSLIHSHSHSHSYASSMMMVMAAIQFYFPFPLSTQSLFPKPLFSSRFVCSFREIFAAMIYVTKSFQPRLFEEEVMI